jgi:K+-sensing histidine kinase KdpD
MTPGFGFPFGCVAAVAAVISADLAGATAHPWYALVTLAAVVLTFAHLSSLPSATGVAVVAWALHTGFVLNRFGELRFDHAAALAAVVLAAALLTGTLTHTVSTLRSRVSTRQSRESTLQTREPTVRGREFAGRVLRAP